MNHETAVESRFALRYEPETYRRVIADKDVIIHCHHYNARVQRTVEGAGKIDGKSIIRESAEAVFVEQLAAALREGDDDATRRAVAERLYAHLGFGVIDLSRAAAGEVRASASHFVEGWLAGFGTTTRPVCTFTEGYIQAAISATTGELVHARETACVAKGDPACVFALDRARAQAITPNTKRPLEFSPARADDRAHERSPNIDAQKIIDALVSMPIHGNDQGLIPAFSVYLANMPADFYNLVCIRFVEEMAAVRRGKAATRMLVYDGEVCAMNTFRGIMNSAEWEGLVAPMIKERRDNLFGLIAISNGLGWGNWHIVSHPDPNSVEIESLNGYEALGYREYRGVADEPKCAMLTGVAAGLMELVYVEGTVQERIGTYGAREDECICCERPACRFAVERL